MSWVQMFVFLFLIFTMLWLLAYIIEVTIKRYMLSGAMILRAEFAYLERRIRAQCLRSDEEIDELLRDLSKYQDELHDRFFIGPYSGR